MTEAIPLPFDLPSVRRKKLTVDFDGGNQSSDAGLLLVRWIGEEAVAIEYRLDCDRAPCRVALAEDLVKVANQQSLDAVRHALFSLVCAQSCAWPPTANSSAPVTKLESSDARNSAALAISSGSATRPSGSFGIRGSSERRRGPQRDLDIENAFDALTGEPGGGVVVLPVTFTGVHADTFTGVHLYGVHREQIVSLAARYRLPAV